MTQRQIYADLCAKYLNNPDERIKILEQAIAELDEKHLQRLRIREQIEKLRHKQAVSGAGKPDRAKNG